MSERFSKQRKDTIPERAEKMRERLLGPRTIELDKDVRFVARVAGRDGASVELIKGGADILRVSELVPAGTTIRFNLKEKWKVDFPDYDHPVIHIGKVIGVQDALIFMHEVMHARNTVDSMLAVEADMRHGEEVANDQKGMFPESRVRALQDARKHVMRSERNAWAGALRQLRSLERTNDISILKQFGTHEDIRAFINSCLDKYEQTFVSQLYDLDVFTKGQMMKLFDDLDKPSPTLTYDESAEE